ncbi:hypothetical protein [Methylovulum psychrotolerans]|uniref:Peptidase M41 domain-containing protein n=1 Tax=Methylovulum psychrotolerans TaxID=1704499 RepID=A0A2S5CGB9_9GAMM|nr:hypothetical protein [Methylovulum psychrotolerans]POZ49851.1 hypothetical protein AADEFJLK_04367 [Methylovulum psychrotolerans]
MNRIQRIKKISRSTYHSERRKVAIHEAGHAAAIYFGNREKKLPPVFFQIVVQTLDSYFQQALFVKQHCQQPVAKIEGGRLIQSLPPAAGGTEKFSTPQLLTYKTAFEADMINLLVGPLAEAKYSAIRDDELLGPRSINAYALTYYGGLSDLTIVNQYLDYLTDSDELRENELNRLFLAAFNFISETPHWLAITALADYILANHANVIDYHEAISVLEAGSRATRYFYC